MAKNICIPFSGCNTSYLYVNNSGIGELVSHYSFVQFLNIKILQFHSKLPAIELEIRHKNAHHILIILTCFPPDE